MDGDSIIKIGVMVLVGLLIWFLGRSLQTYSAQPSVCAPSVLKVTGDKSYHSSSECSKGAQALPPEKVVEEGKEIYIVRCTCPGQPATVSSAQ